MTDSEFSPRAPAVLRAAAILDFLVEAGRHRSVGVNEIARELDLPKSSVSNICAALESIDAVARHNDGYRLGRRLAEWGGAYLDSHDYLEQFMDELPELPVIGEETVQVAVLAGLEVVYIARSDGTRHVSLSSAIGRKLPATSTATGKALLARLSDAELDRRLQTIDALPQGTSKAQQTVAGLRKELKTVRANGYAIDDEEMVIGVQCVAIAMDNPRPNDDPIAISCTYVASRAEPAFVTAILDDLHTLSALLADPFESRRMRGSEQDT